MPLLALNTPGVGLAGKELTAAAARWDRAAAAAEDIAVGTEDSHPAAAEDTAAATWAAAAVS